MGSIDQKRGRLPLWTASSREPARGKTVSVIQLSVEALRCMHVSRDQLGYIGYIDQSARL